jgi:PEGA domain
VLLAVVLVTHAATAVGADDDATQQDAERKAAASAHLKRGAELIDAEDLAGALAEFEAAYRLVPSPNILHNFGIVYQGLGRKAAALDAFERFLAQALRPPPAAREHALRAVQALHQEVAELRVETDLAGATIFVDGRNLGLTPQERPIYLDAGPHHLSVEKAPLGTAFAERLEVSAGQRLTVPVRQARAATPVPAAAVEQSPPPVETSRRRWQRPAAWATTAGAVLAAALFGTQILARYLDITKYNNDGCGTTEPDNMGGPGCPGLIERASSAEKRATVSGVAAVALGLGATVLFVTLPETPGGLAPSLRASPSQLGLGLQGRF